MEIVEDVVHADDLVVEVVVALRRRQERVAEGDEQIEDVDRLSGQGEEIELADERRVAGVQELEHGNQRRPQLPPRTQRETQSTSLLVAQHAQHNAQRQFVELVRELLHQVTQDELDDQI